MEAIGFIGLGKMGIPISRHIMEKFPLAAVYNRSPSKTEWLYIYCEIQA